MITTKIFEVKHENKGGLSYNKKRDNEVREKELFNLDSQINEFIEIQDALGSPVKVVSVNVYQLGSMFHLFLVTFKN